MNISAKEIIDQIDKHVAALRQGVGSSDQATIVESATVIEAYCQLLKKAKANQTAYSVPMEKTMTSNQIIRSVEPASSSVASKGEGNLLDF